MSKIPNTKSALIASNSVQITTNTKKRRSFIYRYFGLIGKGFYIVEGKMVTEREFEKMFPTTATPIRKKGKNMDGTKIE